MGKTNSMVSMQNALDLDVLSGKEPHIKQNSGQNVREGKSVMHTNGSRLIQFYIQIW